MAFPTGAYDPTATQVAADKIASRQLSSNLWRDVNPMAMIGNPAAGLFFLDTFADLVQTTTNSTAGTTLYNGARSVDALTDADGLLAPVGSIVGAPGICAHLDSVSVADGEGVQVGYPGLDFLPTDGFDLIYEARVCAVESLGEYFVGFHEAAASDEIILSDVMTASKDWFGHYSLSAGAVHFGVSDGSTVSNTSTAVHTMVIYDTAADGKDWVKLGGRLSGTANANESYVNGVKQVTDTITQSLGPNKTVNFSMSAHANGTTAAGLYVDWVAVGLVPK